MITYTIRTNVKGKRTLETDAVFTTGDVQAYRLRFVFYDNGVYDTAGCSLMVKGKRSDGVVVIDEGVIDALGNAFYDVKSSMYAVPGELALEVALLTEDGGYITVKELTISVREGFGEGDLAEDTAPLLTELHKTLEEAKEVTEKARPIGDVVANEEGRILAEAQRNANEETRSAAEVQRAQAETERIAAEEGRLAAEEERQAGYEQMGNLFANALVGSGSGGSVCLDDVSPIEHIAEVKVSGVDNLETITLVQCGLNLFNPLKISAEHLQFSGEKPNLSNATLKNDQGMRINSIDYDGKVGIVAIQEETKKDNVTPVTDITKGTFTIYFNNPSPYYKLNDLYTFVADVELLENKHPEGNIQLLIRASHDQNYFSELTGNKTRIRVILTAKQNSSYPNRRSLTIVPLGKSVILKNIMWLPGKWTEAPEYEEYKETTYPVNTDGTVNDVVLYSPSSVLTTDTDGVVVECKYNKDSNKVIEKLTNAIISLGGNV
ncbi:MAG: hypothetical protein E7403_00990 [Ruminococcaceae bacterium]|nr:hypothetical protein [Oscillospiraceae bacterium]